MKGIPKEDVMPLFQAYERKEISLRQIARNHHISPAAVSQRFKRIREGNPASAQEVEELRAELAVLQQTVEDLLKQQRGPVQRYEIAVERQDPARNLKELMSRRRA